LIVADQGDGLEFEVMKPLSRRTVLRQTGLMGALAAPLPLVAAPSLSQAELRNTGHRKLKVIVCGGHPGDPEYGCGGTVARYADLGHEVVLLYLNRGEWPPNPDPAAGKSRMAEGAKACEILGARPLDAGHLNGRAVVDQPHYESFRKIIERERPDVLFTQWPIDNHADHRAISMLAYDAWLKLGKTFAFYYYEVSNGEDTVQFAPTHYVDITATEPRKRKACYAHASQTPDRFYALQEMVTRMRGVESGHRHAESFIRHVQSPDFGLPLA
jgi:LmbE family N-acetylglucosaminyl deacetylase